jgi:uncharacterized Fe-S cluster-containing MiaB family protein
MENKMANRILNSSDFEWVLTKKCTICGSFWEQKKIPKKMPKKRVFTQIVEYLIIKIISFT